VSDGIVFIVANKKSNTGVEGLKYYPDCVMSINHNFVNDITEQPVETGESFTDHIQNKNKTFTISGRYNPYNLTAYAGDNIEQSRDRLQQAYNFLVGLRDNRSIVTLVSKWASYPDCAVSSLDININPDNSNVLEFSINFTQIRRSFTTQTNIVQVQTVAPPKKDDASKNKNEGRKNAGKSVAAAGWDWLADAAGDDEEVKEIINDVASANPRK
jgi:hypothetical protein